MAKLKDDNIRWILELDAKGVQGELNTLSSSTDRLKKENRELSVEMKKAERNMRDAEKSMAKMEARGKTNTDQYRYAKEAMESNSAAVQDFSKKIQDNNKAIDDNNQKKGEIIKTMKIEDMTMTQLEQRAGDLQKQLNTTSVSADPKAYKALQKELGQVNERMFVVDNSGKNLMQQFAAMHNPVGQAAKGVLGVNQAFKTLAANPIVLIITIVVGLFTLLYKALKTSEEATNKLNQIMAPLKVLFDAVLNVLQKIVISLLDFAMAVINGFTKVISIIPGVGKVMDKVNEKAREGIELEKAKQQLAIKSRELLVVNAGKELEISRLRNEAKRKDTLSDEQRLAALDKALQLEKEITEAKVDQEKETLRIAEAEAARAGNTKEVEENLAQLRANVLRAEKEFYDNTRRVETERTALVLEMQREREQKAKEAIENRVKNIENALNIEINKLKQARSQGLITEAEYNRRVEEEAVKSLQNQLKIKGLGKDKQIAIQAQLYDILIKEKEKYEKLLADTSIETSILTNEYNNRLKLAGVYNVELSKLTKDQLAEKIRIENEYQSKLTDIAIKGEDERHKIALQEAGVDGDPAKLNEEKLRVLELLNAHHKANLQKIEDDYDKSYIDRQNATDAALIQSLQQSAQARFSAIDAIENAKLAKAKSDLANGLITQEQYNADVEKAEAESLERRLKEQEEFVKTLQAITNPTDAQIEALEAAEDALMDTQDKINDKKIKQEQEFQEKKKAIVQGYIQKTGEIVSAASDFVQALQSSETSAVQADYEKRLSGLNQSDADYAQKKEQLEQERAQAELDIQKKFADAQFAIQVAQIGVATATGIMNAWASSMTIPPPFGQIMAGVLTALLVGTGIAQVAAANAERQKIKSMTLSSSGGGFSSASTGQIRLKDGLADGGYNQDFSKDGGYTGPGQRYDVAGTLPVHSGEYVVAVPELRRPDIAEKVRSIERVRRRRTSRNPLPEGFAEGGSNTPSGNTNNPDSSAEFYRAIAYFKRAVDKFAETKIEAEVNYWEFKKTEDIVEKSQNLGRRS
ncbi:MAG: hypothetical protein VB046_08395 [Paludibacter sp.]|nr:hypothetical protein [Paludibacter sp.]